MSTQQEPTSDGTGSETDSSDKLELLVEGLLEEHKFLHEYRLQKLVYLAELLYLEREDGESLTNADYKPYRYGAYSEDVKDTIKELSNDPRVKAEHTRKYGNDTWTYKPNGLDPNLPDEIEDLVEVVMDLSRHKSNDELAKWSKSTYLFEETDYDSEMELTDYFEEHLKEGNRPDWKSLV